MGNVFSAFSEEEEFPFIPVQEMPIPEDADYTKHKLILFYLKPEILWEHISSVKPDYPKEGFPALVINDEIYWFISAADIDEASTLINFYRDPHPVAFARRFVAAGAFIMALSDEEDRLLERNCRSSKLFCCHCIPFYFYENIFPERND
jgi:hypothetical protein